jgi:hypothetical protein
MLFKIMNALIFIIALVLLIAWLLTLVTHLKSTHMDPTDKVCWTVVLCTLNLLGLVIYVLMAPKIPDEDLLDTEDKIKRAANEGRLRK